MNKAIDVALILWNQDVIDLLSWALLDCNLESSGVEPSEGAERIENLIASSRPAVIVFDLRPPYIRSTEVASGLLNRFPDRSFVMTCADKLMALKTAPWLVHHALLEKPYEVDEIAKTIRTLVIRASGAPDRFRVYGSGAPLAIHSS